MEDSIQVTVRSRQDNWKEMDLKVNSKQSWNHIVQVLLENGLITGKADSLYCFSQRKKCSFEGKLSSEEMGIYSGDIIEISL